MYNPTFEIYFLHDNTHAQVAQPLLALSNHNTSLKDAIDGAINHFALECGSQACHPTVYEGKEHDGAKSAVIWFTKGLGDNQTLVGLYKVIERP